MHAPIRMTTIVPSMLDANSPRLIGRSRRSRRKQARPPEGGSASGKK